MSEIKNKIKFICLADYFIFALLLCLLALSIFFKSSANIQHDSGDYYSILQRLTDSSKKPVIPNTHFVEQRSPGYSIISTLPYYLTSLAIEPLVKTEKIVDKGQEPPGPPNEGQKMMGIPSTPLLAKDIFFKNFYIEKIGGWFEWKIISSLLFTSYFFLFAGIIFSIKTLALRSKGIVGFSLPILVIVTSIIFMQNIIMTPAYATLTAFGMASIFCYFFVRSFEKDSFVSQFLAGLFLGLLVLTRLETVLIAGSICFSLICFRKWRFLKQVILGGLLSIAILLFYNFSQFGNPFYFGILKGDINQIGFNPNYIFANLFNPKSGILFWSPLTSLGLIGLFLGNKKYPTTLGVASLALIALLLVRVPVMYKCIGGDPVNMGGILVDCTRNMDEALMLIQSDANRYITVLAPFAVLGLQNLLPRNKIDNIKLWKKSKK